MFSSSGPITRPDQFVNQIDSTARWCIADQMPELAEIKTADLMRAVERFVHGR